MIPGYGTFQRTTPVVDPRGFLISLFNNIAPSSKLSYFAIAQGLLKGSALRFWGGFSFSPLVPPLLVPWISKNFHTYPSIPEMSKEHSLRQECCFPKRNSSCFYKLHVLFALDRGQHLSASTGTAKTQYKKLWETRRKHIPISKKSASELAPTKR